MKRYLEYINEVKKSFSESAEIDLVDIISDREENESTLNLIRNILKFNKDININYICSKQWNYSLLLFALVQSKYKIAKLLLEHPDIDITIKSKFGSFMDHHHNKNTLIDYDFQNKILENGREDILYEFDRYGLIHSKIKEENEELFKANKWGLT